MRIKIKNYAIIIIVLFLKSCSVSSFLNNNNINKHPTANIKTFQKSVRTKLHESISSITPNNNNRQEEELLLKLETSVYKNLSQENSNEARVILSLGKLKEEINTQSRIVLLSKAAITGIIAGLGVSVFKLSIEEVRQITYGSSNILQEYNIPLFLIPTFGGLAVSLISALSKDDKFPPGLSGVIKEVDQEVERFYSSKSSSSYKFKTKLNDLRRIYTKAIAAIFTLGTGCSLGPEGPSVEVGIAASRLLMGINDTYIESFDEDAKIDNLVQTKQKTCLAIQRQRVLLACGAAAGVSSGFNAPIAAVFFALEIVQASLPKLSYYITNESSTSLESIMEQQSLSSKTSITAILLSSVLASLVSHQLLGNELALQISGDYSVETPIFELPLYLVLGALSGFIASLFTAACKFSNDAFGNKTKNIPNFYKPIFGGFACGIIGIAFPQILFFGYDTLNSLLQNVILPLDLLVALLFVKLFTTALSAGSGLVGGTFAPSLFMGAMLGASFHETVTTILHTISTNSNINQDLFTIANIHSYSIVGAASVLAAMFKAPLTATLLLFELTRDYNVIVPLMASAGIASLVGIYFNERFEKVGSGVEDLILMVGDKDVVVAEGESNR